MFRTSITTRPLRAALLLAAVGLLSAAVLATRAQAADPTIAAVGDMACSPWDSGYNSGVGTATRCRQRYVSDLLVNPNPAALLDLGDNQYADGDVDDYWQVYDPTFGRANGVVYPSIGNAEYDTANAQGFYDYFAGAGVTNRIVGTPGSDTTRLTSGGYYSFDIGSWHAIALNSNCGEIGGCGAGSPQEVWLKNDLAAHPNRCTLAYWHHPRWNSGALGNDSASAAFWTDLYNARADLVLNGHANHHYERQLPQTPTGTPNAGTGIRQFIVSTGGESHGTPPAIPGDPNTLEVADYTSFGVLRLTLHYRSYDWQFVPATGGSFTDSGSGTCHAPPDPPAAPSLSATADTKVHLSWNVPFDGGAAVTSYKVYRGTTAGGETLLTTLGNVTSYDDGSVTSNTKYWYRVAAVNSAGDGTQSNEVSATPVTPPPPPPPSPTQAFPSTTVLDNFARAPGGLGSNWQSPGLADAGTATIKSNGITASSAGPSSATWKASTFGADQEAYLTVPVLPTAGNFLQVAGRVSSQVAANVSCYFLRVTPASGVWELREKLNGGASTLVKTFNAAFTAGDTMGLRIAGSTLTAYRKAGAGAWSAIGSATDATIPGAGYVSFTLGDTVSRGGTFGGGTVVSAVRPGTPALTATAGDDTVRLSWTAPSDGGAAITGYNLYRGTAASGETLLSNLGNVSFHDDNSVANGTSYYYRVAAVNSVGEGTQSNEVSATPAPPQPSAPAAPALTAVAGDATVHLAWNSPSDGGAAITGYNLYRGTAAGGETLLSNLGNVTSYDDNSVANGTSYYYEVAAVNSVGEGTRSNEVSATPAPPAPLPLTFPRTPVLDSFARAAGGVGSSWQSPGLADAGTVTIKSPGLTGSSAGAGSATWTATTLGANQEAYLTVPTLPRTGGFMQVAARVSGLNGATVSCYFLRVTPSGGIWDLRKKINGGGSTSVATFNATFAAGDSLGLQVIGSTLTAYRKPGAGAWTTVGLATDTAISAGGYISYTLGDTTIRGGAFGGGTIN